MAIEIPKTAYSGKIRVLTLGKGDKAVTVGGESCYPFHLFEGEMPAPPRIAMEVYDCPPQEWAPAALEPFAGVTDDPVAWAKKCINDYGAEMICLQLLSTDPNGLDRGADEAVEVVKRVADAIEKDKPEDGKVYALTGGPGDKCISNGNSWKESEVNEKN